MTLIVLFIAVLAFAPSTGILMAEDADDSHLLFQSSLSVKEIGGFPAQTSPAEIIGSNLSLFNDREYAVSGHFSGVPQVWDTSSGKRISVLDGHSRPIKGVTTSPDGRFIATSGGEIRIWDSNDPHDIHMHTELNILNGWVASIHFSPDGSRLIAGSYGAVALIDTETFEALHIERWHTDANIAAVYLPDNRHIVTAGEIGGWSDDGNRLALLQIWDTKTNSFIPLSDDVAARGVARLAIHPESSRLLLLGKTSAILWTFDTVDDWSSQSIQRGSSGVSAVFSPDGRYVYIGTHDGSTNKWDILENRLDMSFPASVAVTGLALLPPERNILMAAHQDGSIRYWNTLTGELLVSSIAIDNDRWLSWTPQGFFTGSDVAISSFTFITEDNDTIPIASMKTDFHRPEIIQEAIGR